MGSNLKMIVGGTMLFIVLVACTSRQSPVSEPRENPPLQAEELPVTAVSTAGQSLWIEVPTTMRYPGQANLEAAVSWEARLAKLPDRDRVYMKAINDRYYGALEFANEQEQRELTAQGFPMPEEWLAARDTPDAELERQAIAGNQKARMFHIDRVSERVAPVLTVRGFENTPGDQELFRQFVDATAMVANLLHDTRSPFAAYLAGRVVSSGTLGGQPEAIAASFQLARELGDPRADSFRDAFLDQHPGMDVATVMTAYSYFKSSVDRTAADGKGR